MYQNYTINQLCLPIDLEAKIEENDFVHAIVQFVDSIPDAVFLPYYQSMGRPQYHPRMLLSIILCAYIQGVYSGRQIQNMLIDSIRMRYLSQEQFPNFRTINRFRVHPIMNDILDHSFVQFRELLVQSGLISGSALYIDGTKIEADANKYSFVWKKSILKFNSSYESDEFLRGGMLEHARSFENEVSKAPEKFYNFIDTAHISSIDGKLNSFYSSCNIYADLGYGKYD